MHALPSRSGVTGFPCWHVDCECNRRGREPKRLSAISSATAKKVYPDIIVHRRLTDQNLLLIEVKKTGRRMKRDKEKLVAFSQEPEYRYQYGLLLVLPGNRGPGDILVPKWNRK